MILVFGSINVDLFFTVDVIPAAGQTRLARDFHIEPGGKGANQALAARRAGADVALVGAIGNDAFAPSTLTLLRADGVDISRVMTVAAATGCATIATDKAGANSIFVAAGANALARAAQIDDATLAGASLLLLQGETDLAETEKLIARAAEADTPVLLNLAPPIEISEAALRSVQVLVVNEDEAASLAARFGSVGTAKGLHLLMGIDVVRTRGADGCEAASFDGLFEVPGVPIAPVDTTAAGDCFVGVLAAHLARGDPLPLAMRHANVAAAKACEVTGSQGGIPWTAASRKTG